MASTTPSVVGGYCTGHGCFPPTTLPAGSPNVYAGGQNVGRVTDEWSAHTCDSTTHAPSARKITTGSNTVFVNGKKCARLGSDIACGSKIGNHGISEGAKKVYIGD